MIVFLFCPSILCYKLLVLIVSYNMSKSSTVIIVPLFVCLQNIWVVLSTNTVHCYYEYTIVVLVLSTLSIKASPIGTYWNLASLTILRAMATVANVLLQYLLRYLVLVSESPFSLSFFLLLFYSPSNFCPD